VSQTTRTDTAKSNTGTAIHPASPKTALVVLVQLQPTPHDRGDLKPRFVAHGTTATTMAHHKKYTPTALSKPNASRKKSLVTDNKCPPTARSNTATATATATVTPTSETNSLDGRSVRTTDAHRVVATVEKATEQQHTNVVKTEVVLQPRQTLGLPSTSQVESIPSTGKRCLKKAKYDTAAAPSPSVHSSTAHRTHIKLERGIPPEALARTSTLPEPIHAPATTTIASSHSRWDALLRVCVAPLK
jgi:hypothetical protein